MLRIDHVELRGTDGEIRAVAVRILATIGRELSARLRTANRTIHQLET